MVTVGLCNCLYGMLQESIPAAQFDWSSSGLTNPLEGNLPVKHYNVWMVCMDMVLYGFRGPAYLYFSEVIHTTEIQIKYAEMFFTHDSISKKECMEDTKVGPQTVYSCLKSHKLLAKIMQILTRQQNWNTITEWSFLRCFWLKDMQRAKHFRNSLFLPIWTDFTGWFFSMYYIPGCSLDSDNRWGM